MKKISFVLNLMFLIVLIACGGGGGGDGAPAATVTNEYRGTYVSTTNPANTGTWSLTFTQNGSNVTGTWTISGEGSGNFTGSVSGSILTMSTTSGSPTFDASAIINGTQLTGTSHSSSGSVYNFTGSIYSGSPLVAGVQVGAVISGTPVSGNPPLPTTGGNTPVATSFTITPSQGSPSTSVHFNIVFTDADADVVTCAIRIASESGYYTYNTASVTNGQSSFSLNVQDMIGNIPPQSLQISAFVVDAAGNVSNYLNGTFNVTGAGALDKITLSEYYPIGDGNIFNYTNNGQMTQISATYPPYIMTPVIREDSFESGIRLITRFWKYDNAGYLCDYGGIWQNGSFNIKSPSAVQFPAEMEIGKEYTFSYRRNEYDSMGTLQDGQGTENLTISVSGPEALTVPLGTYLAYKIKVVDQWTDTWGGSGGGTSYMWCVKNLGAAKQQFNDGSIYQLTGATVNGISYP